MIKRKFICRHRIFRLLCKSRSTTITIFTILILTVLVGHAIGGVFESTDSQSSEFYYKPFSEAEINAVVQNSLTLDDCIRIALTKNLPLQITHHDFLKSEASHYGTYSIFFPVFSINGTKEKTKEDRSPVEAGSQGELKFDNQALIGGFEQLFPTGAKLKFDADLSQDLNSPDKFGSPPTRTRNRRFSVSLTQPLLREGWPAIVRSPVKTAGYNRQIKDRQFFNTKLQTIFLTKQAVYDVILQRELIKVNEAAIQRDSTLLSVSEFKVQAQLATRRDVLSAEIQLAEDNVKLIKSQTDYQNSLDVLKEVMGLPLDQQIEIGAFELDYSSELLDENYFISQAKKNNPSIHGAEIAIARSQLQLKVAKNSRLPQLDVIGSFLGNFESDTDQNIDVNTNGWEVGVNLSYPLFARQAAANTQIARTDVSQMQDRLSDVQRQIELSIRKTVRNTRSNIAEIKSLERSIEAAEQKVAFSTTMFNLGRASNLDITDAQEALLKNQTEYIRNLVDYKIQLALLESLISGPLTE